MAQGSADPYVAAQDDPYEVIGDVDEWMLSWGQSTADDDKWEVGDMSELWMIRIVCEKNVLSVLHAFRVFLGSLRFCMPLESVGSLGSLESLGPVDIYSLGDVNIQSNKLNIN